MDQLLTRTQEGLFTYSLIVLLNCLATLGPGGAHAQGLNQLTSGQSTFRPVVNNGRVLWYSIRGPVVSVMLDEGSGAPLTITADPDLLFTGPPDLDEFGNVVYVEKRDGAHQVVLARDGTHLRLTDNPTIPGSPSIGLGTDKGVTGWPRISNGRVVFCDVDGDVFLYDPNGPLIRQINTSDADRANTREEDPFSGMAARKIFEFDGSTVVWFHRGPLSASLATDITVYMAKPFENASPQAVTTFHAWMPGDRFVSPGLVVDPFFVACGDQVAWQYWPPTHLIPGRPDLRTTFDDGIIEYYDGTSVRTIRAAGPVAIRSIRIHNGQVAWYENAIEPEDPEKIYQFDGSGITEVASFPSPPFDAPIGSRWWISIRDVDTNLGHVAWLAQEVECQTLFPGLFDDFCAPVPTQRIGLFTGDTGLSPVATFNAFAGGSGDFSGGLYAFLAHTEIGVSGDVMSYQVQKVSQDTNVTLELKDTRPQWTLADLAGERRIVADAFKLSATLLDCGASSSEAIDILAMTVKGQAVSGIDANLSDVESLKLYYDTNRDGDFVGEPLLAETTFVDANATFQFEKALTVYPGVETHLVLVYELTDALCPCNRYESSLAAEDIDAVTQNTGSTPTKAGQSRGKIIFPEPKFTMYAAEEMFGGDEQAAFAEVRLPKKLGIRVANFPIECGQAMFSISDETVIGISRATLIGPEGNAPSVTLPFVQDDEDAVAEIEMILGMEDGLYVVEASIDYTQPASCESPTHLFREHAGRLLLEIVDASNPNFYDAGAFGADPASRTVTLTSDYERLSGGGDRRVAVTADGESMLLIRAKLVGFTEAPAAEVEFTLNGGDELGFLTTQLGTVIPPTSGSSSALTSWQATGAGVIAIALYTPPNRIADSGAIDLSLTFKAETTLPSDPSTVQEITEAIALRRPPILFVHGMWADKTTWGSAYIEEDPRFDKYYADYSSGQPAPNAMSFAASGDVIRDTLANIIQEHRSRRIAATQAVIVAHSMGGLLTRQYIADFDGLSNQRPDNFGRGDIHKFITMGTPHWGSPVAWLTKTLRDHSNPLIQQSFLELINALGMDIFSGAIDGMCPNSADLQDLGESVVPTHTIQAWYLDGTDSDVSLTGLLSSIFQDTLDIRKGKVKFTPIAALLAALGYFAEISVDALYMFDKTDFMVTTTGQDGGILNLGATSVFDNTTHMALGTNLSPFIENETDSEFIAAHVFDLMDEPLDGPFATGLPAPESQNSEIECQAPAPDQFQAIRLAAHGVPHVTESLPILAPLDRQIVHPGDIVTVTLGEIDAPLISALFLSRAEVTFIETDPFQAQMEVPAETVGEFPIVVAARDLTGNLRIGKVTLLVEQNAQLNELIVQPAGLFMKPGMRLNLRVDGLFSDGVTRKLTDSGTLYLSADEGVVTVDEFGSVEYQGPGGTTILVTNGEVEQVVKVRN